MSILLINSFYRQQAAETAYRAKCTFYSTSMFFPSPCKAQQILRHYALQTLILTFQRKGSSLSSCLLSSLAILYDAACSMPSNIASLISSYYKVVVFIVPLQGLYAILLEILWVVASHPTTRWFQKGYNHSLFVYLLISQIPHDGLFRTRLQSQGVPVALNSIKFIQRRFLMIYVGIDVAKDKHDCFITNSDGEVLFKSFTISNNREGF